MTALQEKSTCRYSKSTRVGMIKEIKFSALVSELCYRLPVWPWLGLFISLSSIFHPTINLGLCHCCNKKQAESTARNRYETAKCENANFCFVLLNFGKKKKFSMQGKGKWFAILSIQCIHCFILPHTGFAMFRPCSSVLSPRRWCCHVNVTSVQCNFLLKCEQVLARWKVQIKNISILSLTFLLSKPIARFLLIQVKAESALA